MQGFKLLGSVILFNYLGSMKTLSRCSLLPALILFTFSVAICQSEQPGKSKKPFFCGYKFKDTAVLRTQGVYAQLPFLHVNNGDTIVDIGSSSGALDGAFCAAGSFENVHFVLVDIDSNCLNAPKVNDMINYYTNVKGAALENTFSLVVNNPDSLMLPLHHYSHVWMFNTLHEIDNKEGIAKQMTAILRPGGELIIAEILATPKRPIHAGCKKKLMSKDEIITLFNDEGLVFKEYFVNPAFKKVPYYFFRFIMK
jgi:ubiquinone/menaquinone biosynthesis C-methylase UbiE